jgi:hypothetical protein
MKYGGVQGVIIGAGVGFVSGLVENAIFDPLPLTLVNKQETILQHRCIKLLKTVCMMLLTLLLQEELQLFAMDNLCS